MLDIKGNELLVPALIGLGLYAKHSDLDLANNTSILLILFLLLKKGECHDHKEHHKCGGGHYNGYPYPGYGGGGIVALGGRGGQTHRRNAYYVSDGCCCYSVCSCGCTQAVPQRGGNGGCCGEERCCDPCDGRRHHHHKHERVEEFVERLDRRLDKIERCACGHGL